MKRLTCKILIGNFEYVGVVEVAVESTTEALTDTCKIKFPRKVKWNDKKITELIKRGDKIEVNLGYEDNNDKVFTGYIKSIKADIPVEIECEDGMFLLKKSPVTKSYENVTLKQVLTDILPSDINFECVDFNFSSLRISKSTPAKVLETLQSDFGMPSYFRNEKLYVGLSYWNDAQTTHYFIFQRDIINNKLEYNLAEDLILKVVAVSINDSNEKIEYEAGDVDGDQRTFYYYGISLDELKIVAEEELQKLKYDGYRGSFTTFGQPHVKHGDIAKLTDYQYPEREGLYLIKSVKKTFNFSGYRQEIELDRLSNG